MDDRVLDIADGTYDVLELLRPASKNGSIAKEVVLSIKSAQGSVDMIS